jgi:hypothetical protein
MTPEKNKDSQEININNIPLPKWTKETIAKYSEQKHWLEEYYNNTKENLFSLLDTRNNAISWYQKLGNKIFDYINPYSSDDYFSKDILNQLPEDLNFEHTIDTLSQITEIIAKFWVDKIDWNDKTTFTHDGMWSTTLQADINWSTKDLNLWKDYGYMMIDKKSGSYLESKRDILENNEWLIKQLCKLSLLDRKKYFDKLRKSRQDVYWKNWIRNKTIDIKFYRDLIFKDLNSAKKSKNIKEITDIRVDKKILLEYENNKKIQKNKKSIAQVEQQDKTDADQLLQTLDTQVA